MKQEPTAWLNKERDVITFDNLFPEMTPLYEKREWVGLTDEELPPLVGDNGKYMELQQVRRFYKYIEAKLKEKNT